MKINSMVYIEFRLFAYFIEFWVEFYPILNKNLLSTSKTVVVGLFSLQVFILSVYCHTLYRYIVIIRGLREEKPSKKI